jgi:hypothetical protein
MVEDVVSVVVVEEIVGRAYCHRKAQKRRVDKLWTFVEVEDWYWLPINRSRDNDWWKGNPKVNVDSDISGMTVGWYAQSQGYCQSSNHEGCHEIFFCHLVTSWWRWFV